MSHKIRTFRTTGTVSRRTLVVAACLVVAGIASAVVRAGADENGGQDSAITDARRVLSAARAFQANNGDVGCPTISVLEEARELSESARTDDPWGNRFRIVCDAAGVRVVTDGPDHRAGTRDDVRVE